MKSYNSMPPNCAGLGFQPLATGSIPNVKESRIPENPKIAADDLRTKNMQFDSCFSLNAKNRGRHNTGRIRSEVNWNKDVNLL